MSYVFLSITTTKGNAYKNGNIVELGAVKYDKRGKMLKTFDVINRIGNLDDYSDAELSCGREMVIRNGESVKTWLIRLHDFIGDNTVVMFEAYETFNYLKSYGLELTDILDLRLLLKENKTKNYDDFLKLTQTHIKGNLKVSKKILKPVILKEIFFGLKLQRKQKLLNEFRNDLYVRKEVVKYNGVLTDDKEDKNLLHYADGRVEEVVDELELYERHLKNVFVEEKDYFGQTFEDVIPRFRESFEDVYFKNMELGGRYYRADIEGRVYLITPTTLSFDDDLNIENIYDVKTMSKLECFRAIDDNIADNLVANFFKSIIKNADPDYAIEDYDYFVGKLESFIEDINSRLGRINKKHRKVRRQLFSNYDLSSIEDERFRIDFTEYNGLVIFSVDEIYRDSDLADDEEPEGNIVIRLDNRDIEESVSNNDYDIRFDSERYNYLVYEQGIKPLEDSLKELVGRTNNLVKDMEKNLPIDPIKEYKVKNIDIDKLLDLYGTYSTFVYSTKQVRGRGKYIRTVHQRDVVKLFLNGSIDYVDSEGRTLEVENINDVLDYNEVLYDRIKEHYKTMDKLFKYDFNDFEAEEGDLVSFDNNDKEDEGYQDFEIDYTEDLVTDIENAKIVSKMYNEYSVNISLDRIFDIRGMKAYFSDTANKRDSSSVEFPSSVQRHREVLEKIIDMVNDKLVKGDVSRGNSEITFRDGVCRISDENYYIDYDNSEIKFENDKGSYKITYVDKSDDGSDDDEYNFF